MIVGWLGLMLYSHFGSEGAWADAEAEADRDDPRWRLFEIEADRPQMADSDNSALYIMAVLRKGKISVWSPNRDAIFENLPANAQLNAQQVELIRTSFAKVPGQIEAARKLKGMPAGRCPLKFSDDWISTLIPNQQDTREIADWLKHDAMLLAQEGDCDAAIESCQGIVNVSRSVKDDPFLITNLIRFAELNLAMEALERVLAQGEPSEERLASMQAMLERELPENSFLLGIRGERAGTHYLFENLRAGKVKQNPFALIGRGGVDTGHPIYDWMAENFPSTLIRYYPDHLRTMNRMVAAARLPLHERNAALKKIQKDAIDSENPISRLLLPATDKVETSERRLQIYLRSMIVALACERYRLKDEHKRWPAALDDLVKAKLLTSVPTDPIDNQPLRFRRTKEGVVIYSVGLDGVDNQGNIQRDNPFNPGVDLGYRLFDPQFRRRQPLPPVGVK